jgi:hypothetical protein
VSRCRESKIVEDPFNGSGLLVCDLDDGHLEDYHEDRLNEVLWKKKENEEPAMVVALPLPPHGEIPAARCEPEITGLRKRVRDALDEAARTSAAVSAYSARSA